jgi:hypothetical protein
MCAFRGRARLDVVRPIVTTCVIRVATTDDQLFFAFEV